MLALRSLPGAPRRLLLATAWSLVLGGLFAMHGLGSHGAGAHEAMTHGVVRASGSTSEPIALSMHDRAGADVGQTYPREAPSSSSMLGLCVGVLGGIMFSVLLLLVNRRPHRPMSKLLPPLKVSMPAGRDRDPPSLALLSMQRC